MNQTKLILCIFLLLSSGFGQSSINEEVDIREAVFRYQMKISANWNHPVGIKFFYLSFGNQGDPPDEFIQRFKDHTPPVKKESEAESKPWGVNDGLILTASKITWHNKNEVDVRGGYYRGELYAAGILYLVAKKDGQWVVTRHQVTIVS